MKKQVLIQIGIVILATVATYGLMAIPVKKQQQRVTLSLTVPEVELVLKALSELPLKESGGLYLSVQDQANRQLTPPQKPKVDSTAKPKKQ